MKNQRLIPICFFLLLSFQLSIANNSGQPIGLKCEYLTNPLGIDVLHPRFSWMLTDNRQGAAQTAYQILVASDSSLLNTAQPDIWNSGMIKSSSLNGVLFQGKPLKSKTRYYWQVVYWDQNGVKQNTSSVAFWETGMLNMQDWKGDWISDSRDIHLKPAPYFRKVFTAKKAIKAARAYIAVAGLYELYLNGQRVGDHRLDPMYTRFDRRTLYVTYDITSLIKNGQNAAGVLLGNGWYNHQSTAVWYFDAAPWRGRPKFCMDITLIYSDGSEETIATGTDWKTSLSPIIFNSIYTAEHYDARKEQSGWNTTEFNDSTWKSTEVMAAPSKNIVAQALHPIRYVEEIPAKSMTRIDEKTYLFDLGRNIAGISEITVSGEAGTMLRSKHAERLNSNGRADQSNIDAHYRPTDDQDPFQTDIYYLKGKGEETFKPHFNYKGFQYVEVTSDRPVELTQKSVKAFFMHSDVPATGSIEFSNPTMNKIVCATKNSYLSNLFGYPTDCPQREKNGWTGDAHIASETGLYNFDGITIYEKWLADHRDEQQPNGVLPSIVPSNGWGYAWGNGPDWTSTIAIIPWNIYLFYGDAQLLEKCYDNIRRYVNHISELYPSGITDWGLGDWIPVKSKTPKEFSSSVYYYVDADILAKTAKILGKEEDYRTYRNLADKIKKAINDKYLNPVSGIYGSGYQTELSMALQWKIVPENLIPKVAENLAKRVIADDRHLDVGLLGTKAILNALSENGYADLAYQVASQESYPSWGWWVKNGATTLFENWPIDAKSDISMNHIMFGEIGAWTYKALAGIKPDPENPGFKHLLLQPNFVNGLNHVKAEMNSIQGRIASEWTKTGKNILWKFTIPANSSASLILPKGKMKIKAVNPESIEQNPTTISFKEERTGSLIYEASAGTYEITIN